MNNLIGDYGSRNVNVYLALCVSPAMGVVTSCYMIVHSTPSAINYYYFLLLLFLFSKILNQSYNLYKMKLGVGI